MSSKIPPQPPLLEQEAAIMGRSRQHQHPHQHPPTQPQHKMVGGYALLAKLGSGSFATVYKAVKKQQSPPHQQQQHQQRGGSKDKTSIVAIKAITRNSSKITPKVLENLELEISILQQHQHPNIVSLTQVIKSQSHIYLVLEYCAGGDLQGLIRSRKHGRLSERLTRRLMRDLTWGITFLGQQQLIHRDIKPQNLLLTGPLPLDEMDDPCKTQEEEDVRRRIDYPSSQFHLKIADFGFARHLQKTSLADTLCGSPLYMAPEILQHQRYDNKADLWSVGTVLFEMITGRPPYLGENHIDLLHNIQRNSPRLPPGLKVSKECFNLLCILLNRLPKKRAGLKEFVLKSQAFVNLGCNGSPPPGAKSDAQVVIEVDSNNPAPLVVIPEDEDDDGSVESCDDKLRQHDKKWNDTMNPPTNLLLPPLPKSPTRLNPLPWTTATSMQQVQRAKTDSSSSGSDDSEFVIVPTVPKNQPISPKKEIVSEKQRHTSRNVMPNVLQKPRQKRESKLEMLKRTLNAANDVGRRAINVAKVGDSRAQLGIQKSTIPHDDSSICSLNTPMEGLDQESAVKECSSFGSSPRQGSHIMRARTVSDADQSFCRPSEGEMNDCDDDEMPFAMSPPSEHSNEALTPFPSNKNDPPTIEQPTHDSVVYFQEGLMCYMKALAMLKSSVHTSRDVFLELSSLHESALVDSNSLIQELKAHCERSHVLLSSQFKAVLERADAVNVELSKVEENTAKGSRAPGIMSRQTELTPFSNDNKRVDELIYNHSLAFGREGAVKQLLGHYDAARSCYRSAGLLAETLLLNPNLGFQDKAVLDDFFQGFLDRINELDSSTML